MQSQAGPPTKTGGKMSGKPTTQASGLRQSRFRTMGLLTLITSGLLVIRPLPREHPATTRPLPNVYNISGFHSSTEVDESDVERHLGNDRPKPSNLRNLCGAAISAAQFHPSSRA